MFATRGIVVLWRVDKGINISSNDGPASFVSDFCLRRHEVCHNFGVTKYCINSLYKFVNQRSFLVDPSKIIPPAPWSLALLIAGVTPSAYRVRLRR